MKILVGCEESQAVTIQLRKLGHDAYSCDTQDCSGGHPEWHIKGDVLEYLNKGWDIGIFFPPCTHLAVSGSRYFEQKRKDGRQQKAIEFFMKLVNAPIPKIAIENPIGIMNKGDYIKRWFPNLYEEMLDFKFPFKPTQIIHPYYFGDNYAKSTCLWLKGLPKLIHTKEPNLFYPVTHVDPEFIEYNSKKTKSGKSRYSKFGKLGKGKGKERSKTPNGFAKAIAEQWTK